MKTLVVLFLFSLLLYFHLIENSIDTALISKHNNPQKTIKILEKKTNPKHLFHLAKLYQEQSQGSKALFYFQKAFDGGCTYALMNIADIYNWGLSDTPPNTSLAKKLYTHISLYGDHSLRSEADEKLLQMFPQPTYQPPIPQPPIQQPTVIENTDNIDFVNPITNDPQNVHDTAVMKTIKTSIDNLKQNTPLLISKHQCFSDLKKLSSNPQVHSILNIINKKDSYISSMNMQQSDALQLVWNRINQECHKDNKTNLQNSLITELESSYENNIPVCSTGIFNRIIDSLNIVDPLVTIKPKWIIQEEILDKCSKLRQDLVDKLPSTDKLILESGKDLPDFDDNLKQLIRDTCKTDYVDSNILSQDSLDAELNKWIDHI